MSKKTKQRLKQQQEYLENLKTDGEKKVFEFKSESIDAFLSLQDEENLDNTYWENPKLIEEKAKNSYSLLFKFISDNSLFPQRDIISYLSAQPDPLPAVCVENPGMTRLGMILNSPEKCAYLNNLLSATQRHKEIAHKLKNIFALSIVNTKSKQTPQDLYNNDYDPLSYSQSQNIALWQLLDDSIVAIIRKNWLEPNAQIAPDDQKTFFRYFHTAYWLGHCQKALSPTSVQAYLTLLNNQENVAKGVKNLNAKLASKISNEQQETLQLEKKECIKNLADNYWNFYEENKSSLSQGGGFEILANSWMVELWDLPTEDVLDCIKELSKNENFDNGSREYAIEFISKHALLIKPGLLIDNDLSFMSVYYPLMKAVPETLEENKILVEKIALTQALESISLPLTSQETPKPTVKHKI